MSRRFTLLLFLVLVLGGGLAIGYLNLPGAWYAGLAKPPFNPPSWVFPPAWTTLYVLIAMAGARTWGRDRGGWAMRLWWAALVLNFAWSPSVFGAHQLALGMGVIVLLLAAIVAFIATTWRKDRTAALLFVPYAAWVAFASALNAALLALNGRG